MTSHEKSTQQVTFAQYQQPSNYPYNVAQGSGYFCFHRGRLHLVLTMEYKRATPFLHITVQLFLASSATSFLSLFGPISTLNACHIITSHLIRLIMHWSRGFVCTLNVSYLLMSYKIGQFMSHLRGCLLNPCRSSMLPAGSTVYATTGNSLRRQHIQSDTKNGNFWKAQQKLKKSKKKKLLTEIEPLKLAF